MITQIFNRLHRLLIQNKKTPTVKKKDGFILLFTLVLMVTLLAIVAGYLYLVSVQTRVGGSQLNDTKAFDLAEAGLEWGIREMRDDVLAPIQTDNPNSLGYHGNPSIDGSDPTSGALSYGGSYVALNINQSVRVRNFLQITNLLGTRLKSVELGCRYRINNSRCSGVMDISYTTDDWNNSVSIAQKTVDSTSWNIDYFPLPANFDWSDINTSVFGIEARMIEGLCTRRNLTPSIYIDYLFIRPTYEVDASTEPWYQGFNNIPLGDGNIESVNIIDESGKVHLNYASGELLHNLMLECKITDPRAQFLTDGILNYRAAKMFDSIEEIKNIAGMNDSTYAQLQDYVSVYSFINKEVSRPAGERAPVNVNTASEAVLTAIFDSLGLGINDPARLAQQIISRRSVQPFTYFYSSAPDAQGTDLYSFINSRTYLSPGEKKRVEENVDASDKDWGSNLPNGECVTTEFSYYTDSFMIEAVGRKGDSTARVRMVIKDDGNKYLDTYVDDTDSTKYWRQIQ